MMKLPLVLLVTGTLLGVSQVASAQWSDFQAHETRHLELESLSVMPDPCVAQTESCHVPGVAITPETLPPLESATQLGNTRQLSHPQAITAQGLEGATVTDVQIQFIDHKGQPIANRVPQEWVRAEIRLQPGDRFSQGVVQADLRQLYQLGLFRDVTVAIEEVANDVIITYNVEEWVPGTGSRSIFSRRSPRSLGFGAGYNNDVGAFGIVSYRDVTIGGLHQRLEADVTGSVRDVEYDVRFISPYRVAEDTVGYALRTFRDRKTSDIFNEDIDLPNGDEVREFRIGGSLSFNRPIGDWDGALGLNFTRVSTRDEDGDLFQEDELWNPLTWSGEGIDDLYTLSLGVTRNWMDNPFNPRRGALLSLSTEQSVPIGVGEITMNRLRANYVQYIPMRWLGSNDPHALPEMFAFNLQAGTIIGDLPPHQAFALGGMNSVRGYGTGGLGTGRRYALASGEYRFPLWRDIGGVFFADVASDLGSADDVLGNPADVRDKPGTGAGVGVGVRVRTLFGLFRIDVGVSNEGDVEVGLRTGQRF